MVKNMKNVMTGTYIRNDETYSFNFGTDLSMAEKAKFVNSVVDLVVDDLTKRYNFILRDLIVDFYTIKYFTDIDIAELENSTFFVNDVEQFLEETNIVEIVKENAFPTLFDELNKAINNSIEYITGIHSNPLNEALASLVNTLEKNMNKIDLNSAMSMAKKFAEMTGELTSKSIVDAYMESDVHKKNLEEIAESKQEKVEDEIVDEAELLE